MSHPRTEVEVLRADQAPLLAGAADLLNRVLGKGMYSPGELQQIAQGPGTSIHTIVLGPHVQAASVTRLLEPRDAGYYERFGPIATGLFAEHRVGSLEALAVDPARRRQGLGHALVAARLGWIAGQGYDCAAGVAWLSGRPGNSEALYRSLGFTFSPPLAGFYLEESIRDGWTCPVCRAPCRCAAAFFYRLLPSSRPVSGGRSGSRQTM